MAGARVSTTETHRCDDCGTAIKVEWSTQYETWLCLNHFLKRSARSGSPVVTDEDVTPEPTPTADLVEHYRDGTVVLSAADHVTAVWGEGSSVAWPEDEPLMLTGGDGTGKTMLAQQLTLYRTGIRHGDFLGMPVAPSSARTLYVAADRPAQALRSMKRMVTNEDSIGLGARLGIWQGPLPFDLVREPKRLASWIASFGCDGAVIDCLKDVAPRLSSEETGFAVSVAMQTCMVAGIQLVVLHHSRKAQADNKRPNKLSDVYGSRFLTASCGSVFMLWGEAGDPVVECLHLKQPGETIGPLTLLYDMHSGTATVHDAPDVLGSIIALGNSATVTQVAQRLFGVRKPKPALIERARRQLDGEVRNRRLRKLDAEPGDAAVYGIAEGSREGVTEGVTGVTADEYTEIRSKGVTLSREGSRPESADDSRGVLSLDAGKDESPTRDFASWPGPYVSPNDVEGDDDEDDDDWRNR